MAQMQALVDENAQLKRSTHASGTGVAVTDQDIDDTALTPAATASVAAAVAAASPAATFNRAQARGDCEAHVPDAAESSTIIAAADLGGSMDDLCDGIAAMTQELQSTAEEMQDVGNVVMG